MYNMFIILLAGWTLSLLASFSALAAGAAPALRHVVVIGIDGLSPDGISSAATPALDGFILQGASTMNARAVLPTSSSTNWKSMLSAAGPAQHGVTSNNWERDDYSLPPVATGLEAIFPTLFGQYRLHYPQAKIAAVYTWSGLARLIERSALNYDRHGRSDEETTALAKAYLIKEKPALMFVHLDEVDGAGHQHGHKTPAYYEAVTRADQFVKEIVAAVTEAKMLEHTVFLITSDHGGIGYGHGGETLDEVMIPFILFGAGVKTGYRIQEIVYTYDTAATAAWLLKVSPHPGWIGKPVLSAFKGHPEPPLWSDAVTQTTLAPPVLYPKAHLYEPAGGLYIDQSAEVRIESTIDGAQIRYTLDGSEPTAASEHYAQPFSLEHSATVKARQFIGTQQMSPVVQGHYHVVQSNSRHGIRYRYFEGDNWSFLPTFASLTPEFHGLSYQFRLNDIPRRKHGFAIEYSAWLKIDKAGWHKFYTYSDDGSKLYIGDQEVVNNDGAHGTLLRSGKIELAQGYHPIRVTYFNQAGGAWLEVLHKAPGQSKQPILPEKLFTVLPR